jgi:hypothetical protein
VSQSGAVQLARVQIAQYADDSEDGQRFYS